MLMVSTKKKVNKSAWIRSQPAFLSAADVVAKAKKEGIKLSVAQVYTARSTAKKAGSSGGVGNGKRAGAGDEAAFKRIVVEIGVRRAEALLEGFKRDVGL